MVTMIVKHIYLAVTYFGYGTAVKVPTEITALNVCYI